MASTQKGRSTVEYVLILVIAVLVVTTLMFLPVPRSESPTGQAVGNAISNRVVKTPDTCTDTDGGLNKDVRGIVSGMRSGKSYSRKDYCQDSKTVKEYVCKINQMREFLIKCDGGGVCEVGRCVSNETYVTECVDSDDGLNYDVRGYAYKKSDDLQIHVASSRYDVEMTMEGVEYTIKLAGAQTVEGMGVVDVTLDVSYGSITEQVVAGISGTPVVNEIKIKLLTGTESTNVVTGEVGYTADLAIFPVTANPTFSVDECVSGNLMEYYCEDDSRVMSKSYECPGGCEWGVCIQNRTIVYDCPAHSISEWVNISAERMRIGFDCEYQDLRVVTDDGAITYNVFTDDLPVEDILDETGNLIEDRYAGPIIVAGAEGYGNSAWLVESLNEGGITVALGGIGMATVASPMVYTAPDGQTYSIKLVGAQTIEEVGVVDVTLEVTYGGVTEQIVSGISGTPTVGDLKIKLEKGSVLRNPGTGEETYTADLVVWFIPSEYTWEVGETYNERGVQTDDDMVPLWKLYFNGEDSASAADDLTVGDLGGLEGSGRLGEYGWAIDVPNNINENGQWDTCYDSVRNKDVMVLRWLTWELQGFDMGMPEGDLIDLPFFDGEYLLNDMKFGYQGLMDRSQVGWEQQEKTEITIDVELIDLIGGGTVDDYRTMVTVGYTDEWGDQISARLDNGPFEKGDMFLIGNTPVDIWDVSYDEMGDEWIVEYRTKEGASWNDEEIVFIGTRATDSLIVESQEQDAQIQTEYRNISIGSGIFKNLRLYMDAEEAGEESDAQLYIDVPPYGRIELVNNNGAQVNTEFGSLVWFSAIGDSFYVSGSGIKNPMYVYLYKIDGERENKVIVGCYYNDSDCEGVATGEDNGRLISLGGSRISVEGEPESELIDKVTIVVPRNELMPTWYFDGYHQKEMTCDIYGRGDDDWMPWDSVSGVECTDTDGGKNYEEKGTATWGPIDNKMYNATDRCDILGETLSEHYCYYLEDLDGWYSGVEYIDCECVDGACEKEVKYLEYLCNAWNFVKAGGDEYPNVLMDIAYANTTFAATKIKPHLMTEYLEMDCDNHEVWMEDDEIWAGDGSIVYTAFLDDILAEDITSASNGSLHGQAYRGQVIFGSRGYYVEDISQDEIKIVLGGELRVNQGIAAVFKVPGFFGFSSGIGYNVSLIGAETIEDVGLVDVTLEVTRPDGVKEQVKAGISGSPTVGDVKIVLLDGGGATNPTTGEQAYWADLLVWYLPSEILLEDGERYDNQLNKDDDGMWKVRFNGGEKLYAEDLRELEANGELIWGVKLPEGIEENNQWGSYRIPYEQGIYGNDEIGIIRYIQLEIVDDVKIGRVPTERVVAKEQPTSVSFKNLQAEMCKSVGCIPKYKSVETGAIGSKVESEGWREEDIYTVQVDGEEGTQGEFKMKVEEKPDHIMLDGELLEEGVEWTWDEANMVVTIKYTHSRHVIDILFPSAVEETEPTEAVEKPVDMLWVYLILGIIAIALVVGVIVMMRRGKGSKERVSELERILE
jgi:hypothetical protein